MLAPLGGEALHLDEVVRRAAHTLLHAAEDVLRLPERPSGRWRRAGVTPRGERVFNVVSGLLLVLFAGGWSWSIAMASTRDESTATAPPATVTSRIATALSDPNAPSAAFLTEAALEALTPLRGESGRLRASFRTPGEALANDTLPAGTALTYSATAHAGAAGTPADALPPAAPTPTSDSAAGEVLSAPAQPGIWQVAVRAGAALKSVADFSVITLVPRTAKQRGRIGLYYLGSWPGEKRGSGPRRGYAPPSGFIEVTPENQDTWVSDHFRLRDFLTHDQQGVWPKYLVLREQEVDKLELVMSDLEAHGISTKGVRVMSGFRSPQYNAGGGVTTGRAELSRHMYGDAADVYIDNDGDGVMDDLNHDGRININDARVIQAAVDRVEASHPAYVGGCGVYPAAPGHGPFTHIDTRGYRARWVGTGDG
jgi:Bacterial protein of unknown function (DUF882)